MPVNDFQRVCAIRQLEMGNERILPDVGAIVTNGEWLSGLLTNLKNPGRIRAVPVPKTLHAALRPYQKEKDKFAPDMTMHVLYGKPSAGLSEELANEELFSLLRLESR